MVEKVVALVVVVVVVTGVILFTTTNTKTNATISAPAVTIVSVIFFQVSKHVYSKLIHCFMHYI